MKQQTKISGVDVSNYAYKWDITQTHASQVGTAKVEVIKTITSAIALSVGQTIEIWRSFGSSITDPDDKKFKGTIEKITKEGPKYILECRDMLYNLFKEQLSKVYVDTDSQAGVVSEIFKDIVVNYGNLSADNTTIQNSGTVNTLQKFICNNNDLYGRCKELAQALNWQFYYNPVTDKVYFEPKGYTSNSNTLTVGTNIVSIPEWENDTSEMTNDVKVIGAKQLVEDTEFFSGDGSTKEFILSNTPESIKVYVGGTLKIGGVEGISTGTDYTVDKINKKIKFSTAPASATNNIEVRYTYNAPIPLNVNNYTSIATYGTYKKTYTIMDVRGLEDAIQRGSFILDEYANPFKMAKLKVINTATLNLKIGQKIKVVDTINNVSDYFIINKISYRYPLDYDVINVGQKEFELSELLSDIQTRIKKREEEELRDSDKVINLVKLNADVESNTVMAKAYLTNICDSFILGSALDNSKLGMGEILDKFDSNNWTSSDLTLALDNTTVLVGTNSLKLTFTSSGNKTLSTTNSFGDLSDYVGVSSGTATKGTIGLWVHNNSRTINSVKLKIGSDISNYMYYTGAIYDPDSFGFDWQDNWTYLTFDLDNPDSSTGTIDWTSVSYAQIEINIADTTGTIYIDYLTISKSNQIGLNGLGKRTMQKVISL